MTALLRFFIFVFTCLLWQISSAQPLDDPHFHGCRYAKNKFHLPHPDADDARSLTCGSNARSDSLDILNYAVTLDLTTWGTLTAACEITFTAKQNGIEFLPLDLGGSTAPNPMMFVDSVLWQGSPLVFDYDNQLLDVHLPTPVNVGDTMEITVFYHGKPDADASGFGGFVFDNNIGYNLGIGLSSVPYNFGRSWHPCFDNFVERATYDFNILSNGGKKGYAIGNFLGQTDLGGGTILRQYRMAQPLPTYLVGTATSTYNEIHQTHPGVFGEYPILLVCKQAEVANMTETFTHLGDAIDALEAWFGKYIWGQVGYVSTTAGAMEHATLIAFPDFAVNQGQTFANDRLMAHELAHHWWGNVTTLSCPSDMWIKEGNAEYGAHLFTEFSLGREAFDEQVKENHGYVVSSAHKEDDGYWPLSGIPYEHTYGVHTYNKGADIMHNLRGYLGDSLFAKGMRAILQDFQYQSVDAELFRDKLTDETGIDMNPFFNAWIFSPGFAMYELDSVHYSPSGGGWAATIYVQQKLLHAPNFHEQAPLEITFFDENWQAHHATFIASGEFSVATVNVPFQPVWQILNDRNKLNLARMQDRKVADEPGDIAIQYANVSDYDVVAAPDSAMVSFVHYLGAPDPLTDNPYQIQLSSTHYWRYGGIFPPGFKAKGQLRYFGGQPEALDFDLTGDTEDSLILVWKPTPAAAWTEYPFYKKITLGTTDGSGYINIDTLLPGDYAFANGVFPSATKEEGEAGSVSVFPNPASGSFTVAGNVGAGRQVQLALLDGLGRVVHEEKVETGGGLLNHQIQAGRLSPGLYFLKINDLVKKIILN